MGFEDKCQLGGWFLLKNSESQIKNLKSYKTDFWAKSTPSWPFSTKIYYWGNTNAGTYMNQQYVLVGFLYESCLEFSGLNYELLGSFFPSQGDMNIGYDFMQSYEIKLPLKDGRPSPKRKLR